MFSTDSIIPRNLLSNKCSFYFCAIHLLPAEEGEFLLYYVKKLTEKKEAQADKVEDNTILE